jgi:hypothetical protein
VHLQHAADDLQRQLSAAGLELVRLDIDVAGDDAAAAGRRARDEQFAREHGAAPTSSSDTDNDNANDTDPMIAAPTLATLALANGALVDVLA